MRRMLDVNTREKKTKEAKRGLTHDGNMPERDVEQEGT